MFPSSTLSLTFISAQPLRPLVAKGSTFCSNPSFSVSRPGLISHSPSADAGISQTRRSRTSRTFSLPSLRTKTSTNLCTGSEQPASSLGGSKQTDSHCTHSRHALQLQPDNPEYLLSLGLALTRLPDYPSATNAFLDLSNTFLNMPYEAIGLYELGRAYEATDEPGPAREGYEAALDCLARLRLIDPALRMGARWSGLDAIEETVLGGLRRLGGVRSVGGSLRDHGVPSSPLPSLEVLADALIHAVTGTHQCALVRLAGNTSPSCFSQHFPSQHPSSLRRRHTFASYADQALAAKASVLNR